MPYPSTLPESNDVNDLIHAASLALPPQTITSGGDPSLSFLEKASQARVDWTLAIHKLPLIDQLLAVKAFASELKDLEKNLTDEFKEEHEAGEQVISRDGVGYQWRPVVKKVFKEDAIKTLINYGCAAPFMKVSLAAIEGAVKKKTLARPVADRLIGEAAEEVSARLEKVVIDLQEME